MAEHVLMAAPVGGIYFHAEVVCENENEITVKPYFLDKGYDHSFFETFRKSEVEFHKREVANEAE